LRGLPSPFLEILAALEEFDRAGVTNGNPHKVTLTWPQFADGVLPSVNLGEAMLSSQ
jgi:hypothetical protein